MPKRQLHVRMIDGTIQPCVLVERMRWNPDRGCRVGFAKVGDREIAVVRARGEDVHFMQLGAQIMSLPRIRGQFQ